MKPSEWAALAATAGILGVALYVWKNGVDAVGSMASGAVVGVGQAVGIPATDPALCNAAISNNDTFGMTKYCPASTTLANAWSTLTSSAPDPNQSAAETARLAAYAAAGNTSSNGALSGGDPFSSAGTSLDPYSGLYGMP